MHDYMNHIEITPKIMFGKPVIRGTRLTVELILEELGAGKTMNDLIRHDAVCRDSYDSRP